VGGRASCRLFSRSKVLTVAPLLFVLDSSINLDLESLAALAESVQKFEGAVICVFFDQFFVQAVANEAWVVIDGKVKQVASYDKYRNAHLNVLESL
jgi:ATP-binding cassette subfamily F protein 3